MFNLIKFKALVFLILATVFSSCFAQNRVYDDKLGPGDSIKIQVHQSPDLTLETHIRENGNITYMMLGSVHLAGSSLSDAEKTLAAAFVAGGFFQKPQVIVTLVEKRKKYVSVLGSVARPGQYALDYVDSRLSDVLSAAGGVGPTGADEVIVSGLRDGKPWRLSVNLPAVYRDGKSESNVTLMEGDIVYIDRAPVVYVYGEAQRPGAFRLDIDMTVTQALVLAGGPTPRGTERGILLRRATNAGKIVESSVDGSTKLQPNDVIFVRESLF